MKIHIGWMVAAVVVLAGMGMQQGESTEKWEYETVVFTRTDVFKGMRQISGIDCHWPDGGFLLRILGDDDIDWPIEYSLTIEGDDDGRFCRAYNAQRTGTVGKKDFKRAGIVLKASTWPELDCVKIQTQGFVVGDIGLTIPALSSREIVLDLVGQDGWQVFQVDTETEEHRLHFEYHLRRPIN